MTKTAKLEKKEAEKQPEVYSLLQLEKILGVSRLTIADRLRKAGIDPHSFKGQSKLFELTEAVRIAATYKQDEKIEKQNEAQDLKNAKLKLELQKLTGEVTANNDVEEHTSNLFGGLYKRIVVQDIKALTRKVRAAKTEAEGLRIAEQILAQPFIEAKENYTKFLKPIE